MRATVSVGPLRIDEVLYDFVTDEAMPGSGVQAQTFWDGLAALVRRLTPRNTALLRLRDELQSKIDLWHRQNPGAAFDQSRYKAFLHEIGYLAPEQEAFTVDTTAVDPEIALVAGPQLVVPVTNARYALNAANARWGSLYDALYGTDAIGEDGAPRTAAYNPQRGAKVIAFARDFLNEHFPLAAGSHRDAAGYRIAAHGLEVELQNGSATGLRDAAAFRGFQGDAAAPTLLLL